MTHTPIEAIYAIRHKESGKFVRSNGKGCWLSVASAKSSWRSGGLAGPYTAYIGDNVEWNKYELVNLLDHIEDLQGQLDISNKLQELVDAQVLRLQMRISEMEAQLAFYKQR